MGGPFALLPLLTGVEVAGAVVLLVVVLAVVTKLLSLLYRIAVKVVVIAIAAAIVLYALSFVGYDPMGVPPVF
ncbi:hypothetical protein [Haloarchaeobius sp. HRN-SO-5]|uniref:hypothetical protein n=1 Tax=Haloarchaeobius sp. HRN-SO-5 TaxID=3446118 RepID=UPI003EBA2F38